MRTLKLGLASLIFVSWAASAFAVQTEHVWLAPDGTELPFRTDEEILDFLRTGSVENVATLDIGINASRKILLEKDGIRAHAIFREVDVERENAKVGERTYRRFRDSYRYECAAYELAKLLGLGNVPPVVIRRIGLREGSVQIWLERTVDETSPDFRPANAQQWVNQLWSMYLFDNLIFNVDRNAANVLVDQEQRIWLIDHTRAFQTVAELLDDRIVRVDRRLWKKLVALTDHELRLAVSPYLDGLEVRNLLARRDLLVEHVRELVSQRGERIVFY